MMNILVLCTGNSCRSQMAEGFLGHYLKDRAKVHSAGIEAHGLNPRAVAVMKDVGIDISSHRSKTVDELEEDKFDHVLTVCDNAREHCPYFPATTSQLHHNFEDPSKVSGSEEEIMSAFRQCRDAIDNYCRDLSDSIR